jgi:hypothetical protein
MTTPRTVFAVLALLALAAGSQPATIRPNPFDNAGQQKPALSDKKGGTDAVTIPRMLTYQGKLLNAAGQPVADGSYSILFSLYDVSSGGTAFWTETQSVTTEGGLFNVILGSGTAIAALPEAGTLYLGVKVGSDAEMTPRTRVVAVAYAYHSDNAAEFDGHGFAELYGMFVDEGQADAITSGMIQNSAVTMQKLSPSGATTGQVIKWNGTDWAPGADNADNAWVRVGSDSVLYTIRPLGIARAGSTLHGGLAFTHVNLGTGSTTGSTQIDNQYATVGGGSMNVAGNDGTTVAGGINNSATGQVATVGGGLGNVAQSMYAVVAGGGSNTAAGGYSVVGGGQQNSVATFADHSVVAGGQDNVAGYPYSVVGGGQGNDAAGWYSTIGGGLQNLAINYCPTVSGGHQNAALGWYSMVPGGHRDTAGGAGSFAAGIHAVVSQLHDGCFIWGDSSTGNRIASTGSNQWKARCAGGVWFYSNSAMTTGVTLASGSGSWASVCDSANKEDFKPVDKRALLERVAAMRVRDYKMKDQNDGTRHIGPVAQDFAAAFGFGENEKSINMADADGVALAAIQALYEQCQSQQARIEALEAELARLQK